MSAPDEPLAIRATWMRGGAAQALFIAADDLTGGILQRPSLRDALLCRLLGSAHRDRGTSDGLGAGDDGSGRVVIASRSLRPDCDVEFLHGAASRVDPVVDWSDPCDQLAAAVAAFAIRRGWVAETPGTATPGAHAVETVVRLRQQVTDQTITAWVPTRGGAVVETGSFVEDGVPFPGAETRLAFVVPAAAAASGLFPTGAICDRWHVPELEDVLPPGGGDVRGTLRATWIVVGTPLLFVRADALKLSGRESCDALQRDTRAMARIAAIRARSIAACAAFMATVIAPRIAIVAAPASYRASDGRDIDAQDVDVLVRLVDGDRVRDGFPGHAGMALAAAAALPGTLVSEVARVLPGVPARIGHPAGILTAGALVQRDAGGWAVERMTMSRSARRLMEGTVYVPATP